MDHLVCPGDVTSELVAGGYVAYCSEPFVTGLVGLDAVDLEVAASAFVAGFTIVFMFWGLGRAIAAVLGVVRR